MNAGHGVAESDIIARARLFEAHKRQQALNQAPWAPPPGFPFAKGYDELREIPTATYVHILTGEEVPERGHMLCPLHEERTPSFQPHSHGDETGFFCFGCQVGGSIYDFAAHLWGIADRGPSFVELRDRLVDALGRGVRL